MPRPREVKMHDPGVAAGGPVRPARLARRLVLVDDDDLTHRALDRHLRGTGWALTAFGAPEAALDTLATFEPPEVMLVDFRMPKLNGDEFLAALGPGWGAGRCRKYLCTVVQPGSETVARIARVGARLVMKDVILDRLGLLALLDDERRAAG